LVRGFTALDESNHAPVAVLSYGWWTRRFAAAPDVLGRTLYVKGMPFTIVGIAPPRFPRNGPRSGQHGFLDPATAASRIESVGHTSDRSHSIWLAQLAVLSDDRPPASRRFRATGCRPAYGAIS
jgi:hypothetical protein